MRLSAARHPRVMSLAETAAGMQTVDLIYFNAGGGHRAAALALQRAIAAQGRPWNVRLVNLVDVLDPQAVFRRLTGLAPEDLYNKRLARGWTFGLGQELKLWQSLIRATYPTLLRTLRQHWLATEPDLVASLIPNFNRALCESLAGTLPGVPFVVVMTDMADHPPRFWIEPPHPAQHLVCGTPRAAEQARAIGHRDEQMSLVSGMVIDPRFYEPARLDREDRLRSLGLDPARPTGVVMFGGQGSMKMVGIAKALADVQLILMCGHNQALARKLNAMHTPAARAVAGFTSDVPSLLRLADFFIGKPGPASLSEAVHLGLPVITFENAWTMPQERYNARWVRDEGLGRVLTSTRTLRRNALELIEQLPAYRARVNAIHNRAVFEVPEIMARLLSSPAAMPAADALLLAQSSRPAANEIHGPVIRAL